MFEFEEKYRVNDTPRGIYFSVWALSQATVRTRAALRRAWENPDNDWSQQFWKPSSEQVRRSEERELMEWARRGSEDAA